MARRRSITKLMRTRIFDAAKGVCHLCGVKIHAERGEKWEVEHVKPLWLNGADDESNMAPAHIDCHAVKSAEEKPVKAKTDRQRANYLGAKNPPDKPLQGPGFPHHSTKRTKHPIELPPRRAMFR